MINPLQVSEMFYSIQGEGISSGRPSVFVRLTGCNLMCGGPGGKFVADGRAKFHCDSELVWRKGSFLDPAQLFEQMINMAPAMTMLTGRRAAIVWTGGEPTLDRHQTGIENFLNYFQIHAGLTRPPISEIETNGTNFIGQDLFEKLDQINCSPKLSNSGMREEFRIRPEALERISSHPNHWWKFVISGREDLEEIERDFLSLPFIRPEQIILMPAVDKRDDLAETTALIFELAKEFGVRSCSRLHILAWDRATGV